MQVVVRTVAWAHDIGGMAYVPEPDAASFRFTSALQVQLLKTLVTRVMPDAESSFCGGSMALQQR